MIKVDIFCVDGEFIEVVATESGAREWGKEGRGNYISALNNIEDNANVTAVELTIMLGNSELVS